MLYPALPPTPPAIILTMTSDKVSADKYLVAQKQQKPDKVKGLTVKNYSSQKADNTSQSNSLSATNILEQKNHNINPQNTIPQNTIPQNNSQTNKFPQKHNSETKLAIQKAAQRNAVGKIIAAVQEIISVSLYASIDNITVNNNEVQIESQIIKKPPLKKPIILGELQIGKVPIPRDANTENTNNTKKLERHKYNLNSTKISRNTKFNAVKFLSIVQELIVTAISTSLQQSNSEAIKLGSDSKSSVEIASSQRNISTNKKPNNNLKTETNSENNTNNPKKTTDSLARRLTNQKQEALQNNENTQNYQKSSLQLAQRPGEPFLVGVIINGREIGTLDILQLDNTLLIPLESFAEIAEFTVEVDDENFQVQSPLGVVDIEPELFKQINGIIYVSKEVLKEKLKIDLELNTADLSLLADLPWRGGSQQRRREGIDLKPDFLAPRSGISSLKQEFNFYNSRGDTLLRSSSQLGGRIFGGAFRLRLDNNFENQPNISEYFFYKRNGRFRYQVGKQRVGLHPLLNGVGLTGFQLGYSNLPEDRFNPSYNANELVPRRSRPVQTFRGQAPPASFVQLRVGGIPIAQQQVGFDGRYEFLDVRLPVGQSKEIEIAIFDRNDLRVPRDIRSVRLNASDLLLPSGGNVQLAGLGFNGNLVQDSLFDDYTSSDEGQPVGFYQLRQGLTNNLTLEGSLQAVPDTLQGQAGLVWRLANPIILSASVGSSRGELGYAADLDIQFDKLEINANSQSLPEGYRINSTGERFNHSLEAKYRFSNKFSLGVIGRSRKDGGSSADYILPTFFARPFSTLSLNGRPDINGDYLFNAFFRPSNSTRLSFNTYGDAYISDLRYDLNRNYQVSLGSEFGQGLAPRYSVNFGRSPRSLRQLSWNLGLAYSDGEFGPLVGASMQVLPGLFARLDYQGIPSRARNGFGGLDDGSLSVSLISDLSFAGGKVAPARASGIGKERGAIAGKLIIEDKKQNWDLKGSVVRVYDKYNNFVGSSKTNRDGNFFIGNLKVGLHVVELETEELPIEIAVPKTSMVAEVASSAVTRLNFPTRIEYGVAGRITDTAGKAISQVRIELINPSGARVLSGVTDKFGLYRLDGVPVGKYTLQISPQENLNNQRQLPKRNIEIRNEFVYDQNLQLPISTATKESKKN